METLRTNSQNWINNLELAIRVHGLSPIEEDVTRALFLIVLGMHNGNRHAAARSLGLSLKTVYNRVYKYKREYALALLPIPKILLDVRRLTR